MKPHPDRNPATRAPRSTSRRRRKPTRCCPTPTNGLPTISSATPGWIRPRRALPARAWAGSATSSATSSARSSAAAAADARPSFAARTCATTLRSRSSRLRTASRPRSAFRRCPPATPAKAAARGRALRRPLVRRAAAPVRYEFTGPFSIAQTCPRCHGSGSMIASMRHMRRRGRVKMQKTLAVKIPAGVDEGDRVRLSGEGEAGVNGGPPGDLYVQVHLKPHAVFKREHDDLHCEMPISFTRPHSAARSRFLRSTAGEDQRAGRDADGQDFRMRAKGIKGVRSQRAGRPLLPGGGRDAGAAHHAPARAPARVRGP